MSEFMITMAQKWKGHDEDVKPRISRLIEPESEVTRSADYYLGCADGMLLVTEKLRGIFDQMDDHIRSAYFSMISYCAYRYVEELERATEMPAQSHLTCDQPLT